MPAILLDHPFVAHLHQFPVQIEFHLDCYLIGHSYNLFAQEIENIIFLESFIVRPISGWKQFKINCIKTKTKKKKTKKAKKQRNKTHSSCLRRPMNQFILHFADANGEKKNIKFSTNCTAFSTHSLFINKMMQNERIKIGIMKERKRESSRNYFSQCY